MKRAFRVAAAFTATAACAAALTPTTQAEAVAPERTPEAQHT